jgi:4'-phosphopantetheinyl transferase
VSGRTATSSAGRERPAADSVPAAVADEPSTGGPRALVPPLVPGVCQVWWAGLDDARPEHDALLSPADLQRRSRLVRVADRQRLTMATAVARIILGANLGRPPARVEIDRTCPGCGAQHGKPRLPDVPDLQFSVSHSGNCVAVALLRGSDVGVDVEEIGRFHAAELDEMAEYTLAAEERAELARRPVDTRAIAFTAYWTRKEAVVKATGQGVAAPLSELVVSSPSSPPRVLRWEGAAGRPVPLSLHSLHPPQGYAAALAVAGAPPTSVEERNAAPLLRTFPA